MIDDTLLDAEERMDKAVTVAKDDFGGIRTGRDTPQMFGKIVVDYYGAITPIIQLASLTVPEPRMAVVTPYDKGQAKVVEKAIRESDLGLEPSNQGHLIRVPIPPMNEQRRKEMVKVAHKYAEEARIAVRHVRRDGLDHLKKLLKDSAISEDDEKRQATDVQKATDQYIAEIDGVLASKEKEIMQV